MNISSLYHGEALALILKTKPLYILLSDTVITTYPPLYKGHLDTGVPVHAQRCLERDEILC